eukprot:CAMPEP_0116847718 /NCGR_PEP_ID=MMETSP0418-20121206/14587_1 /TAXON_ID=1158023 /ORGANISM="Astrosyne radiata, Strain 13vi08-1A" /LENGTH=334 /DNA_ID=CAMNT_0004479189 /DNA_START=74 /DNA_END=1078 /DNA_ORIENTATION=+
MPTTTRSKSKNESKKNDKSKDNDDDIDDDLEDLTQQVKKLDIDKKVEKTTIPKSIRKVADWINKAKHILVLTGAGISVSAGIPDFRTPGTGLYDNLQEYDLPFPEAVFSLDFYQQNPKPFIRLAKEIWPGLVYSPTVTHSFLALLQEKLLRVYSQNIDGLECLAGLDDKLIVECHGHFRSASCISCGARQKDVEACKEKIFKQQTPLCEVCKVGYVKPDIVFFGESLPRRYHSLWRKDTKKADLLLILGTSLQVAPVCTLPDYVNCNRVLMNREEVGDFDWNKDDENIFLKGNCDDTVILLSKALGRHDELLEQNKKTYIGDEKKKKDGGKKKK